MTFYFMRARQTADWRARWISASRAGSGWRRNWRMRSRKASLLRVGRGEVAHLDICLVADSAGRVALLGARHHGQWCGLLVGELPVEHGGGGFTQAADGFDHHRHAPDLFRGIEVTLGLKERVESGLGHLIQHQAGLLPHGRVASLPDGRYGGGGSPRFREEFRAQRLGASGRRKLLELLRHILLRGGNARERKQRDPSDSKRHHRYLRESDHPVSAITRTDRAFDPLDRPGQARPPRREGIPLVVRNQRVYPRARPHAEGRRGWWSSRRNVRCRRAASSRSAARPGSCGYTWCIPGGQRRGRASGWHPGPRNRESCRGPSPG